MFLHSYVMAGSESLHKMCNPKQWVMVFSSIACCVGAVQRCELDWQHFSETCQLNGASFLPSLLPTARLLSALSYCCSPSSLSYPAPLISPVLSTCSVLSLLSSSRTQNNARLKGKSVCAKLLPFFSVCSLLHPYGDCIPGIPDFRWLEKHLEQAGVSPALTLPPWMQISSFYIPEKGIDSFRACSSLSPDLQI